MFQYIKDVLSLSYPSEGRGRCNSLKGRRGRATLGIVTLCLHPPDHGIGNFQEEAAGHDPVWLQQRPLDDPELEVRGHEDSLSSHQVGCRLELLN